MLALPDGAERGAEAALRRAIEVARRTEARTRPGELRRTALDDYFSCVDLDVHVALHYTDCVIWAGTGADMDILEFIGSIRHGHPTAELNRDWRTNSRDRTWRRALGAPPPRLRWEVADAPGPVRVTAHYINRAMWYDSATTTNTQWCSEWRIVHDSGRRCQLQKRDSAASSSSSRRRERRIRRAVAHQAMAPHD
jgi:hypothetical protein